MWRGALLCLACIAVIAAAAAIIGGGPEPSAGPQPSPRATLAPAAPSPSAEPRDRRATTRSEQRRRDGDRRDGRDERSRTSPRTVDRRMTTAGAGPEADRMRREALRRHAERMRETVELRRPDGPECAVPDAFDVPGCEPR